MKRIFLSLLPDFLFKFLRLENSIALYASENTFRVNDSFKTSLYLADFAPFFFALAAERNRTESLHNIWKYQTCREIRL